MSRRGGVLRRGPGLSLLTGLAMIAGCGQAAFARDNCYAMAPDASGVLRLDTGRAIAWSCLTRAMRAHDELPPAADLGVARRKPVAKPMPAQAPSESDKADDSAHVSDDHVTDNHVSDDIARLQDETARLKEEMTRLQGEASQLRGETARLKDQLKDQMASRDAAARVKQAAPANVSTQAQGKAPDKIQGTIEGKTQEPAPTSAQAAAPPINTQPSVPPNAKGDLQVAAPQTSAVQKTAPASKNETQLSDERAFAQQKGVVERAWQQLLDLAGKMKKDVSGRP